MRWTRPRTMVVDGKAPGVRLGLTPSREDDHRQRPRLVHVDDFSDDRGPAPARPVQATARLYGATILAYIVNTSRNIRCSRARRAAGGISIE
jgi:hypothetical protein